MAILHIPSAWKMHTNGITAITTQCTTLGEAINTLVKQYPNMRYKFVDNLGERVAYLNIFVNGEKIEDSSINNYQIQKNDKIVIVPPIAGG